MNTAYRPLSIFSRSQRRMLVLVPYLGYLLLVSLWSPSKALGWGWLLVVVGLGFLTVLSYGLIMISEFGLMSNRSERELDEREEAVRNRSYRRAYGVLGTLGCTAALYGYIAADSGSLWLPSSGNELTAVFWGVLLLVSTLPAAVLAWTEPDVTEADMVDEALVAPSADA